MNKFNRKGLFMKDSTETVVYIVLGIAIALGINFGLGFLLHTSIPIVAVESNSMVPIFQKGDILIIQNVPENELKKGDIIVFSVPGQAVPIVHRVIEINSDSTFQTKGDANNGQLPFEKSIGYNQVHGKEILIIPYLGWVKIGLIEFVLPNIIWVILVIIVLILIYFIRQ